MRVYIAGPYTSDPEAGVRAQIDAFKAIRAKGWFPFAPLLCHYVHAVHPHDYEDWMAQDLEWLTTCQLVVRLPGESPGADREVVFAKSLGIHVYYGLEALLENEK